MTLQRTLDRYAQGLRARDIDDRPKVSIGQACDLCGVSRRTIYNWLAAGKLEYCRTAGGMVRIYRDTLFRDAEPTP